jgi:hypothetical protein
MAVKERVSAATVLAALLSIMFLSTCASAHGDGAGAEPSMPQQADTMPQNGQGLSRGFGSVPPGLGGTLDRAVYDPTVASSPDGQRPESSAGGPIVPAGVSDYGDMPMGGGGRGAGYVPCPQQQNDSCVLSDVRCMASSTWGQQCRYLCGVQGKYCDAQITHTTTKKPVLLYQCTGCKEDPRCWYANPDKPTDICIDRPNVPRGAEYPICKE